MGSSAPLALFYVLRFLLFYAFTFTAPFTCFTAFTALTGQTRHRTDNDTATDTALTALTPLTPFIPFYVNQLDVPCVAAGPELN